MAEADIRRLDIAMLRTFDALLSEQSVSRAAERLFLSQPAVSATLNKLRLVFDDPLFTRSRHGVVPTSRAVALAPYVRSVLSEVGRLLDAGRAFEPASSERIFRIVGSDYLSETMLAPLCRRLADVRSNIRLFWEAANYASLTERLHKGDIDIGLLPRVSRPAGVMSELLYEDRYVLAARQGHPALSRGAISLDDFCAAPQVFLGFGRSVLEDLIDQALAKSRRVWRVQAAVTSFSQMVQILAQTDHIAVMPAPVAAKYAALLATCPLPFELPPYGVYVCWSRRADSDEGNRWLRQQLLELGRAARPGS